MSHPSTKKPITTPGIPKLIWNSITLPTPNDVLGERRRPVIFETICGLPANTGFSGQKTRGTRESSPSQTDSPLEVVHLALLNSLSRQPDEIVLIEPFIKRHQVCSVGWVKPFKLSNRVNDAIDSRLERCSAPHLITDVIAVLKVSLRRCSNSKIQRR